MEKTIETPDWTKARVLPSPQPQKCRGTNVFNGDVQYHRGQLSGVEVVRISVSPERGRPAPQSYAVLPDIEWSATSPPEQMSIEWQQTNEACFDFFFDLPTGLKCFGLGERYSQGDLRGRAHTLVTTDNSKHTESADALYKAIPFLVLVNANRCSAVFLDSPAPQVWNLDSELTEQGHVRLLSRRGWCLYLFDSASLPEIVAAYTKLTGRMEVPPVWSLGHQQSRWSYPDEQIALEITREFRKRQIPCDTLVLDIDYMQDYRVFTYSKERFPHFPKLAKTLSDSNFKLVTIVDPGVKEDPRYDIYQEIVKKDLACKTPDGTLFTEEVWPGVCVFPDFLKEATRSWWAEKLSFYTDNGVAGIWNDMNEPAFFNWKHPLDANLEALPPVEDQRFIQQAPEGPVGHLEVRNLYGLLMSQATYEGLRKLRPETRSFVLTRSAYAGIQRYAAVWLGDNMSWYEHLRKSIPMLTNVGLSGVPFCGVDIGGFGACATPELLVRWYELGIFYPFFRNHCRMGQRAQEPWAYGARVEEMCRRLIEARYRLLPYIYGLFWEHWRSGAPLMRPLGWHYPNDPIAWETDDEFMFGADILVAPITDPAKSCRHIYLPEGEWYPFNGGEPLKGGRVHTVSLPLGTVPAFFRGGAIIPMCPPMQTTEEFTESTITFHVFGGTASGAYIEDDGQTYEYKTKSRYNEWSLTFKDGQLKATSKHQGYDTPPRAFLVCANGREEPFCFAG